MKIPQKIVSALISAESFIAAELDVRKESLLPDESDYIADAEEVLALVRGALADCEGAE